MDRRQNRNPTSQTRRRPRPITAELFNRQRPRLRRFIGPLHRHRHQQAGSTSNPTLLLPKIRLRRSASGPSRLWTDRSLRHPPHVPTRVRRLPRPVDGDSQTNHTDESNPSRPKTSLLDGEFNHKPEAGVAHRRRMGTLARHP